MISDEPSVVRRLTEELGLRRTEAETYIAALKEGSIHGERDAISSLLRRGMLIQATDEKGYLPVHPRLALSNLFRSYGDRTSLEIREKRKMVDRLTAELIPVYEKGRGIR